MSIKTGRYGKVKWDPAGTTPVDLISLNAWTGEFKTEMEDVTCFGDVNRVYIPGMKDAKGTIGGFWNSANIEIFEAAEMDVPGMLELVPNTTEPTFLWSGMAYLDASIDASLQAPKVTGTWTAAGPFLLEGGVLTAMAAEARRQRLSGRPRVDNTLPETGEPKIA